MSREYDLTERPHWTPRLSGDFMASLQKTHTPDGNRQWADRTINRIVAHLKTWAKWMHQNRPFPLGEPMAKVKGLPIGRLLDIERAITPQERNRILDTCDILLTTGGQSRDTHRYRKDKRPTRKSYRPYRNRAIIYTLIETGMRRTAITQLNLANINIKKRWLSVVEKGGATQTYPISRQGMQAIEDYIIHEREQDNLKWQSPALFLSANTTFNGNGRLNPKAINTIWNQVCHYSGVKGKTPHSARHGVGLHIMEKTGSIAAVQRQLGHKDPASSIQYTRIPHQKLLTVLDDR